MTASADDRLPPLSTLGWAAVLVSGLFILVLAFAPLVVQPTVMKHVRPEAITPMLTIMLSPLLPLTFAAIAGLALLLAVTKARNSYALASLTIAVTGTAFMVAGICSAVTASSAF